MMLASSNLKWMMPLPSGISCDVEYNLPSEEAHLFVMYSFTSLSSWRNVFVYLFVYLKSCIRLPFYLLDVMYSFTSRSTCNWRHVFVYLFIYMTPCFCLPLYLLDVMYLFTSIYLKSCIHFPFYLLAIVSFHDTSWYFCIFDFHPC